MCELIRMHHQMSEPHYEVGMAGEATIRRERWWREAGGSRRLEDEFTRVQNVQWHCVVSLHCLSVRQNLWVDESVYNKYAVQTCLAMKSCALKSGV